MGQSTFRYLITALTVTSFGVMVWIWSEWKRKKIREYVKGKVRGVFLMRSTGKFETKVLEVESQGKTASVRYPEGTGSPVYFLGDVEKTGFDSVYPLGGFMERLGAPIKAIVFLEGNEKPAMELISPEKDWDSNKKLGILLDEKSGEISMEATAEISRLEDKLKESGQPVMYQYIRDGLLVALTGGSIYFLYNLQPILKAVSIALGVS